MKIIRFFTEKNNVYLYKKGFMDSIWQHRTKTA